MGQEKQTTRDRKLWSKRDRQTGAETEIEQYGPSETDSQGQRQKQKIMVQARERGRQTGAETETKNYQRERDRQTGAETETKNYDQR